MSLETAEDVQSKIDALQKELHATVAASDAAFNAERSAVLAARDAAVAAMVGSGELPANFWGVAVVSFLTLQDKTSETTRHFLGPYDDALLRTHLKDVTVTSLHNGYRITLRFAENPFFEGTELWAELRRVQTKEPASDNHEEDEDEDDDDDDGIEDEGFAFSGIAWKPGHGPTDPTLEYHSDDDDEKKSDGNADGRKRGRDDTNGSSKKRAAPAPPTANEGPSMLEAFSVMERHPEDDSELDSCDDDEMADLCDEWEAELEDRRQLLALLAEEMVPEPQTAVRKLAELVAAMGDIASESKRAKTE